MGKTIKFWLVSISLAGCTHEPVFSPSQGHIDTSPPARSAVMAGNIPKPVKSPPFLPPPKPKTKEQTYSVVVNDVPVREILFALARESRLNIDIQPGVTGTVTLNAVDQTLPAILERISRQVDLRYRFEGNVLTITMDIPTLRIYKADYVNMDRDTASYIDVAAQISSTGAPSSTAAGGAGATGGGNNSSSKVTSQSKHNFWQLLSENVRNILKTTRTQATNVEERVARIEAIHASQEDRLKQVEAVSRAGSGAEKLYQEAFKAQPQYFESRDEVIINPVAGSITVMATERQHGFIQKYIDTVMAAVQRQVLIEATIVEVSLNDQFQTGIDWSRLGGRPSPENPNGRGVTFKQSLNGAPQGDNEFLVGYFNASSPLGNLAASLRLLETFGNTRVLSSPKLMALNNQTAILKVVDNLVYFTIQADTTSNQTNTQTTYTTTPHTVPVGVVMSVMPQINENGSVTMNVRPTISRVIGEGVEDPNPSLKTDGRGNALNIRSLIPQVRIREMESVLQVSSGQTVVLGGLMQDEASKNTEQVPAISRLPIIGKLFRSRDDSTRKTELVIFLRPTVIPARTGLDNDEMATFKQYLPDQLPLITTDESAY
ncbi:type II secretion system protein D precursor [mine drainage metagenome]|uniref:Type II secretion system protein D n=1 Tax=mine drainage metagenome TaxID=410659 RepID=A0A1J5QKE2_9ZZZZ